MNLDRADAAKAHHGDPMRPIVESDEPARAEGPSIVFEGHEEGPTVLILDPAGAAKHAEVPATWRGLAEQRKLVWCRLPADGSLSEAEELLSDPDVLRAPIDVVTSGPAVPVVVDLLSRHADVVRSLLLIDPGGGIGDGSEPPSVTRRREELREAGVTVETVAQSPGGTRDRVEPPMPLGHPDVLDAVERALGSLDWRS
ncbi:hypothetical protein [Amycolatopsis palatopharyngis]|uniref:hypothetical protein n=1 Tax=Amycolatopsis palatopharyngis TaxID=187982 RepID=UPI000E2217B4|nr:hypothetical protein [Amycolatopsis palatopharyngis]